MPRLAAALLALLAVLIPASAAAAKVRPAPKGLAAYSPPAKLVKGRHGTAIWARGHGGPAALKAAKQNVFFVYRSAASGPAPAAVSATLAIPKGKTPRGGWPVISFAHGSTGVADRCALTRDRRGTPVHDYHDYAYPLMERWLRAGFAIVRTDYQGLGTPGVHEYLNGRVEGYSVLDAARAARGLARLRRDVVLAGHSQGGHAVLWAASLAPVWAPDLRIRGTLALAPASHLGEQSGILPQLGNPLGGLGGIAAILIRSIDVQRPDLAVTAGLSDRAAALYPQTLTECLPELNAASSFGGLTGKEFLREGADVSVVSAAIGAGDPEGLRIRTPVRIAQGSDDGTVLPIFTEQLRDEYRARGNRLTYTAYPDVTHAGVVDAAAKPSVRWLRGWLER